MALLQIRTGKHPYETRIILDGIPLELDVKRMEIKQEAGSLADVTLTFTCADVQIESDRTREWVIEQAQRVIDAARAVQV